MFASSLSQDMVVEFAKMNVYQLLEETEKAVSDTRVTCVFIKHSNPSGCCMVYQMFVRVVEKSCTCSAVVCL